VPDHADETFLNFDDLVLHDTRRDLLEPVSKESGVIKRQTLKDEKKWVEKPQSQKFFDSLP
jgi:hypothetical protein